jgi:hypothetical protein
MLGLHVLRLPQDHFDLRLFSCALRYCLSDLLRASGDRMKDDEKLFHDVHFLALRSNLDFKFRR